MPENIKGVCLNCKKNNYHFNYAQSVFSYKDNVAKIIQNLKYNSAKYLADPLGEFLYKKLIELNWKIDLITFVPLHTKRIKKRGYNQAEILADQLSRKSGIEIKNILERDKNTPSQTSLKVKERAKNMENAFKLIDNNIKDLNVLIIDDVFTTGATVNEIAKVLKNAKAKNVYVLTLAHTVFKSDY
ncbi:MAG: ComF family protein [Clostridia bacterium]|nr:ComF family protein [Clostridia bacterium]